MSFLSSLTLLANATLAAGSGACATVPLPQSLSTAAQAYLSSSEDRRFMASAPETVDGWIELQAIMRANGERFVAEAERRGTVTIQRTALENVKAAWVRPADMDPLTNTPLIFNLHGGGYALNDGDAALYTAVSFAELENLESVSVDYRLTPQHPYPAALEDAVTAYAVLKRKMPGRPIVVYGLSAGGGLGAAFLLRAKQLGLPLPEAAVLNSPWSDVSMDSDTLATLDCHDPLLGRSGAALKQLADFYAANKSSRDPLVSPVYGDWEGIDVPVLLISGTRDIMLSDTVRLHRAMWREGVPAELIVHEGMWHAFSIEAEFDAMIADSARFMWRHSSEKG